MTNKVSDEDVKELFNFIAAYNNDDRLIERNFLTRMHRTLQALIAERDAMKKDLHKINMLLNNASNHLFEEVIWECCDIINKGKIK